MGASSETLSAAGAAGLDSLWPLNRPVMRVLSRRAALGASGLSSFFSAALVWGVADGEESARSARNGEGHRVEGETHAVGAASVAATGASAVSGSTAATGAASAAAGVSSTLAAAALQAVGEHDVKRGQPPSTRTRKGARAQQHALEGGRLGRLGDRRSLVGGGDGLERVLVLLGRGLLVLVGLLRGGLLGLLGLVLGLLLLLGGWGEGAEGRGSEEGADGGRASRGWEDKRDTPLCSLALASAFALAAAFFSATT